MLVGPLSYVFFAATTTSELDFIFPYNQCCLLTMNAPPHVMRGGDRRAGSQIEIVLCFVSIAREFIGI